MPDPLARGPGAAAPVDTEAAVAQVRDVYLRLREQIHKVIVGQDEVVDEILIAMFCRGHALVQGVPGLAKTLLISTIAKTLSLGFSRIQFTPDLMPSDITGTEVIEEDKTTGTRELRFVKGPIFANVILADEINRTPPKTQAALLEAMQEHQVTVGGTQHRLPEPFFVLATQNPIEQEGTYPLPEAQLDRFFFKILVGYSGRAELSEILTRTTTGKSPKIEPVMSGEQILGYQGLVKRVAVAPHIQDYAVRMVLATHPKGRDSAGEFATPMVNRFVRVGASPRAAQALILGAKCQALLDSRAAVSIEDIRKIALPALRHRIILNFEAEAEGLTTDAVIENLVQTLPVRADGVPGAAAGNGGPQGG